MALQPHRGMNQVVMDDLRGLSLPECVLYEDDIPGLGDRVGGIGFIRIHKSQNIIWTVVALNDLKDNYCIHHDDTKMALRRTETSTEHNVKGALFFTCNEQISPDDQRVCGYNIYPNYPQQRFIIERDHQADPARRPCQVINTPRLVQQDLIQKRLEDRARNNNRR